jgi:predicted ferric reductase
VRRIVLGTFWISLYLLLSIGPLAIIFFGDPPPGRDFWIELSVALGFMGLAMLALQFVVTARINRINGPYGIDVIYQFHRRISVVAFLLICAHPLILFVSHPATYLPLLRIWDAPLRAVLAWLSLLGLFIIVGSSLWRKRLRIQYEHWRIMHSLLAIAVLGLALGHALGVGHYLAQPWQQWMWIAMAAMVVCVTAYVRLIKPFLMRRRPWRIAAVIPELGNSWTLEFEPVGHRGVRFRPGQFAWITVGKSPWDIHEHPFSFSSSAERRGRVAFTIKESGDFTSRIGEIPVGTPAYIDGPHGVFTIDRRRRAPGFVFIAGGVGITPIISMLRTLADRTDKRPCILLYASRDADSITFRDELPALEAKLNLEVIMVLTTSPEGWRGESGYIDQALLDRRLPPDRAGYEYFVCGPPVMLKAMRDTLPQVGIPVEHVEMEEFELV